MNFIIQYNEFCLNYLRCIKKIAHSFSLTQSQVLCIKSIPYDGISQINLSYKLSLDLSTVSRNLDKLKNMKIINKSKLKHDQRSSIITLTNKGKKIYKEIILIFENDINQLILNKINWEFELHYNKNE